tara:strand:+ start:407 stop:895 length:489 start_codon:yes stop_codon:yes gene_type:complete
MKVIKLLFILSIVCCFYKCSGTIFVTSPSFNVDKAFYNKWIGGLPGVRGVKLELHLKNVDGIVFDSLFFQNKSTKAVVRVLGTKIQLLGHYSTSKRTKTDFILDRNVQKELKNPFPVIQKTPFNLKENEAVLSYIKGGKRLFFKIENIKRLQSVFFPSAPKR